MSIPTSDSQSNSSVFRPAAYNFVDLQAQADEYLTKVQSEAKQITQSLKEEIAKVRGEIQDEREKNRAIAEQVRIDKDALDKRIQEETGALEQKRQEVEKQAYDNGFELGKKEGYEKGREQGYSDGELQASLDHDKKVKQEAQLFLAGKIETLLPSLQEAIKQIHTAQQSFLLLWEQSAIHVVAAIADRAIARQMPQMIDVPLRLLREALELAVGCSQMKIHLNPVDFETLEPQVNTLVSELSGTAETEIISDIRITRGGCLIETSLGTIDQRIESRLERIEMELA